MHSSFDPYTCVKTEYFADDENITVNRVQDCEPILDLTSSLRSIGDVGSSEMRHCASFPPVIVERYCNLNGITFHEWMNNPVHVERMLADPDLKYFRVWEGRV